MLADGCQGLGLNRLRKHGRGGAGYYLGSRSRRTRDQRDLAGSAGYSTLQSAVQYAHNKGVVLVAAAGNYGSSASMYPAAYPQVLSVAGSNPDDTLNANSDYGSSVKVAAPWCHWTTAKGGLFGTYCGTSSATPAVAGIAALAPSLSPTATNTQVEQALQSSAAPLFGTRFVQYGRVDALGTLIALGSTRRARRRQTILFRRSAAPPRRVRR